MKLDGIASRLRLAFCIAIAGTMAGLTHWQVVEGDVFWMIRAGREIVATHHVQTVDRWSYTALGQPWFNFQWLSTVILYLVYRIGRGYDALIALRCLLVFAWQLTLLGFIRRGTPSGWRQAIYSVLLLPLIYTMCWFRLQMRPDLFAAVLFVVLLHRISPDRNDRTHRLTLLGLLVLWANLHAGTVAIGILVTAAAFAFQPSPLRNRAMWIAAAVATWIATPIAFKSLFVVYNNAIAYDYNLSHNPDHQPFSWQLLKFASGGWVMRLWIPYTVLALAGYTHLWFSRSLGRLPAIYRRPRFVWTVAATLTLLTLLKIRAIHYQTAFLFPIVVGALERWQEPSKFARHTVTIAIGAAAALVLTTALPDQVRYIAFKIGSGLATDMFPVDSVEFLKRIHPEKNLYNAYYFGGYLIEEFPDYPVAMDGREMPFVPLIRERAPVMRDTNGYAEYLRRHGVNTVLETTPDTVNMGNELRGLDELFYPKKEWALVFFDNGSTVYLRRIPAHQKWIDQYEYKHLRPGVPPTEAAYSGAISDDVRAGIERELHRCLSDTPDNVFCLTGMAALARKRNRPDEALDLLERGRRIQPRNVQLLFELASLLDSIGDIDGAKAIRRDFAAVAGSAPAAPNAPDQAGEAPRR